MCKFHCQISLCKFHYANSIVQIPMCECHYVNSITYKFYYINVQVPLCKSHCAKFHYMGSNIKILLFANSIVCKIHYMNSNIQISLYEF